MINIVESTSFRKKDGVKILIRTSAAFINKETLEILSELPEGATESDYASFNAGRVRKDQTGDIYEIAHDVEDSENTYTEVFPTPDSYCELKITNPYAGVYSCYVNKNMYPDYVSTKTYNKGDMVTYKNMEWISELDDNTGNTPNLYGWDLYLPFVETRKQEYKTLEELNA